MSTLSARPVTAVPSNRLHRTADEPLRSPLRWPAIAMLLAAAVAHVPVIGPHLEEAPYIGALFIALTLVCTLLAVALAVRDSRTSWDLSILVTGLAVLAYVLSRTVGLPQIGDDIGNWGEPSGIVSIITESLTVLLGAAALMSARHSRRGEIAGG